MYAVTNTAIQIIKQLRQLSQQWTMPIDN